MNDVKINKQVSSNEPKKLALSIPIKFKAIILKSIYEKHRQKQVSCLRNAFHLWYIQKNSNEVLRNQIDRILIAQYEKGFTASRFFYRMKFFIRKEKQKVQKVRTINDKQSYKIEDSQINCYGMNKNFTAYFESLKNIFSSKLLQYENQLQSNKVIQSKSQFCDGINRKQTRFKTQGINNANLIVENDQSRISIFAQSQSFQKPIIYAGNEEKQKVKKLGSKVAISLIKSVLLSSLRRCYTQGFLSILQNSTIQAAKSKLSMIKKDYFSALENIVNNSSQSHLSLESNTQQKKFQISQSFIESQSQLSFYVPPKNLIDNQMSQIQYSIDLLTKAIRKDEEVQQLYKQFQQQYQQFETIERDFDKFKIRTKNSLFEKTQILQNKIINHFKKFAFHEIKKYSTLQKLKKSTKQLTQSKLKIENFHEVFSKSFTSVKNTIKSLKSYKNEDKNEDQQQKQLSITSIRMVTDFNPNMTLKSQKLSIKGSIKKQSVLTSKNICRDSIQNRMVSTFDEGFRKDKMTLKDVKFQNSSHEYIRFVNFKLPNQLSENQKALISKPCIKSKVFINDPNFYDISSKSLQSNESSQTNKYHRQIQTHYWWNNQESQQKLNQQNNEMSQSKKIFQQK